jgi:ligand-binding sensor domain-containing protein
MSWRQQQHLPFYWCGLLFPVLFLFPLTVFSQFDLPHNLSTKDGLSTSEIYEMLEDSKGYLWFGSDMGVSRYNGYEFHNFSTENGLPDNTICAIYEDRKQRIWFRSLSGKLSYYLNDSIYSLPCNDALADLLGNVINTSIYVDSRDTIWLGYSQNYFIKIAPGHTKKDIIQVPLKTDGLYIYEIEKEFIYGGGAPKNNLISLYRAQGQFSIPNTHPLPYTARSTVIRLDNGNYLVSTNREIIVMDFEKIIARSKANEQLISLFQDGKELLLGSQVGIKQVSGDSIAPHPAYKFLDGKVITCMQKTRENVFWICTKGHGIFYIPYRDFRYYTTADGLPESSISCMSVWNNKILCGHLSGQISVLQDRKVHCIQPVYEEEPHEVTCLFKEGQTQWVGTGHSVQQLDLEQYTVRKILGSGCKKLLKHKKSSQILLLAFRGLRYVEYPKIHLSDRISFFPNFSDNLYETEEGTIYLCSSNGLWMLNDQKEFVYLGKENPLLASRIVDIQEDKNGIAWMATRGKGVILKKGSQYKVLDKSGGLTGNMCRTIFIDSAGAVWVGTNTGLNRIELKSYEPLRYTVAQFSSKNGLLSDEVNYIAQLDNKLCVAYSNGISVFDPRHVQDNAISPPVYITRVLVNEIPSKMQDGMVLAHNENHLTIHYNGLSFRCPGQLDYKYKLEGLDTNWIYTSYTSIDFQALRPGKYRFILYAKNNDERWSRRPAVFFFTISAAWWQTWWFYALICFGTIALVLTAFLGRLRVVRKREQQKAMIRAQLSEAELKALRAQMNPHFIFNAINSVQYFITANDPVSSQKYLSKFARLIRYVVDNSKPSAILLGKELEALSLYLDLESLRFENKFDYSIRVSEEIDMETVQIPSMLIQPFVENAIWHGLMHKERSGKLRIEILKKENGLICIIEDDGIGRKKAEEIRAAKGADAHKPVGMQITRERLNIINGQNNSSFSIRITDLTDANGIGCGTRVELDLPFY